MWHVSLQSYSTMHASRDSDVLICSRAGWDKNWTDFKKKGQGHPTAIFGKISVRKTI